MQGQLLVPISPRHPFPGVEGGELPGSVRGSGHSLLGTWETWPGDPPLLPSCQGTAQRSRQSLLCPWPKGAGTGVKPLQGRQLLGQGLLITVMTLIHQTCPGSSACAKPWAGHWGHPQ